MVDKTIVGRVSGDDTLEVLSPKTVLEIRMDGQPT